MIEKDLQEIVRKEIESRIGNTTILLGYFEHQVDLLTKLVKDLAGAVPAEKLTPEMKELLKEVDNLLENSSIDFANRTSPFESYKIPNAVGMKKSLRTVQTQYLNARLREGKL